MNFSADIILVCHSLEAGGSERVVATLANGWSRRGRRVCVITMHDRRRFFALDPAVHHVVIDKVGVTSLPTLTRNIKSRVENSVVPKPLLRALLGGALSRQLGEGSYRVNFRAYLAWRAWQLRRALKRVDAPVVVSLGTSVNMITLEACRGLGRRVVISERNAPRRLPAQRSWDVFIRSLYRRADLLTANTRGGVRELAEFFDPRKLAFVPNPLVLPNGDGARRAGGDGGAPDLPPPPFALIVARLVWDKAHDTLLEAFARFAAGRGEWRLAVVGDGELREALAAQAEALGLSSRVHFYGVVEDPHRFYRAASLFVMPSRVEGMSNALLEAMSHGLPPVVSDGASGLLELVEDGVTGLVAPLDDPAALAAALGRLAADEGLRLRLGRAARERVEEYDVPRSLAAWESVIGLGG